MAAGLAGMGVMTVTDLLNRAGQPGPRAELAAASGSSEDALLHWLYQIDLERVHGIGWVRAEWLTGMGVTNAADMARRSAADLQPRIADICRAQGTIAPSEKEVAAWIGHAGTLPQVVYLADDDAASASATLAGGAADAATTLRDDGAVAGRAGLAAGGLVGAGLLTASGYRYDWTQLGFTEKTLADIPAIPDAFVGQLAGAGVTTSPQLLLRGAYPADRAQLAADSGLSADEILHWMYQVDLERVHGIGWSRAAWLRDIDVTTVPDLASRDSAMLYPLVEANFAQRRMQPPARTEVASWISAAKTHEPALFFGEPAGWSYIPAADRTLAGGALLPGAGRAAGGTNLAPATADSTLASAALLGGGALVGGALPGAADGALNTDVAPLDAADDLARGAVDVSVNSAPVADATALTGPADDFALGATDVGANSAPVTGDAALASAALLGGGALAGGALPGAADDNDVVRNREVLAADADPAALPNDAGRAAVYETPPIDDTPVISNLRPGAQVPPAATSVPAPATPVPAGGSTPGWCGNGCCGDTCGSRANRCSTSCCPVCCGCPRRGGSCGGWRCGCGPDCRSTSCRSRRYRRAVELDHSGRCAGGNACRLSRLCLWWRGRELKPFGRCRTDIDDACAAHGCAGGGAANCRTADGDCCCDCLPATAAVAAATPTRVPSTATVAAASSTSAAAIAVVTTSTPAAAGAAGAATNTPAAAGATNTSAASTATVAAPTVTVAASTATVATTATVAASVTVAATRTPLAAATAATAAGAATATPGALAAGVIPASLPNTSGDSDAVLVVTIAGTSAFVAGAWLRRRRR